MLPSTHPNIIHIISNLNSYTLEYISIFMKHNIDIIVKTVPLETKLSYFNNSTKAGISISPAPVENSPFIAPPKILNKIIAVFFMLLLFQKNKKLCIKRKN